MSRHPETNPHFIELPTQPPQSSQHPPASPVLQPPPRRQRRGEPPVTPQLPPQDRGRRRGEPPVNLQLPPQDRGRHPQLPPQDRGRRRGEPPTVGLPPHEQFNPAWYTPPRHHEGPDHQFHTPWYTGHDGPHPPAHVPTHDGPYHSPWMLPPHHDAQQHKDHDPLVTRPRSDQPDQGHQVVPRSEGTPRVLAPAPLGPDEQGDHDHAPLMRQPRPDQDQHPQQQPTHKHTPQVPPVPLHDDHLPKQAPSKPSRGKARKGERHQDDKHGPEHRHHAPIYRVPEQTRTSPITWIGAVCCAILWIAIFLGGLIVLIVYLVYRPRNPRFDISSATLNAAYIDSGSLLNADLTVLANFTNPNKKLSVDFSSIILDLYYGSTLISTQYIEPFSAGKSESLLATFHMVTSQVHLRVLESQRILQQINRNAVILDVKGTFHIRSNFGSLLRYSYTLHGHCTIMLAAPPTGVLRATRCRMKR